MTLHRVLLSTVQAVTWRNGGGSTRELLAWPQRQDWQVRVSVAHIGQDGPFSAFPGVSRYFAVLEGAGVRLHLPSGTVVLTAGSVPVAFDGEAAPGCSLINGPTEDLNLMVRRGLGQAKLWPAAQAPLIESPSRWRAVYAAAPCTVKVGDEAHGLAAGELLWSEAVASPDWQVLDPRQAWCLMLL